MYSTLNAHDLNWRLRRLPADVRCLLMTAGDQCFLAGGFIRACIAGEEIQDIDLCVTTPAVAHELAKDLANEREETVHESDNADSVPGTPWVQFVHRWTFKTPEDCIASFDFTIACAAIWYDLEAKRWKSVCDASYYEDLAAKRLVYRSPIRNEDAGGSLLRLLKFYSRGYRAPLDTVGAVIARLTAGLRNPMTLRAYIPINEHQVGKVLTGLLREVDPSMDLSKSTHFPSDRERVDGTQE